jgi:hypothetical protein
MEYRADICGLTARSTNGMSYSCTLPDSKFIMTECVYVAFILWPLLDSKTADFKDERICIIFHFNLEEAVLEAYEVLKKAVFDAAMSRAHVFKGIHI